MSDQRKYIVRINISRRTTCRLCDSAALELVVPLEPTPIAEKYLTQEQLGQSQAIYPLDLHMCLNCGHVQLLDVVDPDLLYDGYTYRSAQTPGIVDHFETYADNVCRRLQPASNDLVVDIGSNDGTLLRFFRQHGLRVLGVDPAREIAQQATDAGLETLPSFITPELAQSIRQRHGPAAIVTANNVFAHSDDMASMAQSVRHMMAPKGVFVFEVSYLLDVIDRMLLGTIFHEHLCYHSVRPLVHFLKRHEMELIDVERVTIQGGSLICTAQHVDGPHEISSSVDELLRLENDRGLDRPEEIKKFAARLAQLKGEVSGIISEAKRQGKSIAGYGAARSGTTLISQMDLCNVLEYIVDDHPDKVHKYSPGHHIPVLPTKTIYQRMPDYLFILAWIHAKKIIDNNRNYLEQGGHFIVCFPDVQVIGADQVSHQ